MRQRFYKRYGIEIYQICYSPNNSFSIIYIEYIRSRRAEAYNIKRHYYRPSFLPRARNLLNRGRHWNRKANAH